MEKNLRLKINKINFVIYIYMHNFEYDILLNIYNKYNIEDIKEEYLALLSLLTTTNNMTNNDFINKIFEISNIGNIIICYFIENEKINIIASGTIIFEPKIIHGGKSVGHIEDIVVHNSYRSFGIATTILNKLVSLAKDKKSYKVILDCKENLLEFYKKAGFKNNGIQMSQYLFFDESI